MLHIQPQFFKFFSILTRWEEEEVASELLANSTRSDSNLPTDLVLGFQTRLTVVFKGEEVRGNIGSGVYRRQGIIYKFQKDLMDSVKASILEPASSA